MDDQSAGPAAGASGSVAESPVAHQGAPLLAHEERLITDLARLLRYASTAKEVDIPKDILEMATKALQAAKSQMAGGNSPSADTELDLFRAIDALTPKVYPATIDSLEIAEIMEIGKSGGTHRQIYIRKRVNSLVTQWIWAAIISLILIFLMSGAELELPQGTTGYLGLTKSVANYVNPILLGFLGACAYILRNILRGMATQTFVLRDGTSYTLRSILGMILGFMIPHLFPKQDDAFAFLNDIAIPFLAGYAVEPMFAALDTIVVTMRDAVSRSSAPGGAGAK